MSGGVEVGTAGGRGYFDRPRDGPAPPPLSRRQTRWWRAAAPQHRHRRGRRGRVVGPSLVAGVGLALSLPPWGLWVLAAPAAALVWWRIAGLGWRGRLVAGWFAGLGLFVPVLWWATGFNTYGAAVLMAVEALAPAAACALTPPRGPGRTVALAGSMVLAEALRQTWPFGGLPIGGLALGQASGPLAQAARLGGPLLLVALVWLAGGALGTLVLGARDGLRADTGAPRPRRHVVGALFTLAVVVGTVVAGTMSPDGGAAVGVVRAAAVQGGGARGLRQSEVPPAVVYDAARRATGEIARHDGGRPPRLVVWPEDVVAIDGRLGASPVEAQLSSIAVRLDATLLVGVTETLSTTHFLNEVVVFAPSGALVARYEKVHRVPFGEYVPYRGFFSHLADLSAVPLDAVPGHADGVLHTPVGPLGAMVSYEVFYATRGRAATNGGAQLLVVPTNTSSYRTSQLPAQEIAASRLQAIAMGRDLVQAAPTGFSAVVDHRGAVIARSALGVTAVIVRDVALRSGGTPYVRSGDLPVLVLSALAVLSGWMRARRPDAAPARVTARLRPRRSVL